MIDTELTVDPTVVDTDIQWRKRPVTVTAIQYTDRNEHEVRQWIAWRGGATARFLTAPEELQVYNKLENQWLKVPFGHYVIKGLKGEFYPCDPMVFHDTYDRVVDQWTTADGPTRDVVLSAKKITDGLATAGGYKIVYPVMVDWPELQLTSEQRFANAIASLDLKEPPFPDRSIFNIVIER